MLRAFSFIRKYRLFRCNQGSANFVWHRIPWRTSSWSADGTNHSTIETRKKCYQHAPLRSVPVLGLEFFHEVKSTRHGVFDRPSAEHAVSNKLKRYLIPCQCFLRPALCGSGEETLKSLSCLFCEIAKKCPKGAMPLLLRTLPPACQTNVQRGAIL